MNRVLHCTRDFTPATSWVCFEHFDAAGEAADEVDIVTSPLGEGGLVLVWGWSAGCEVCSFGFKEFVAEGGGGEGGVPAVSE